ncbi:hypothetical protein [Piscinibacter sp. XHJ-5]|uniref:hypothetical protein n=1 Tax=Piscinibacter sp. XHJ-5 TaxID=3037797 RepID=UPI00329A76D5
MVNKDAMSVLSGRMEKLLDPSRQDAKCDKCTDERKNQPMLGMTIMRNVKAADDGFGRAARSSIPTTARSIG